MALDASRRAAAAGAKADFMVGEGGQANVESKQLPSNLSTHGSICRPQITVNKSLRLPTVHALIARPLVQLGSADSQLTLYLISAFHLGCCLRKMQHHARLVLSCPCALSLAMSSIDRRTKIKPGFGQAPSRHAAAAACIHNHTRRASSSSCHHSRCHYGSIIIISPKKVQPHVRLRNAVLTVYHA